MPRPATAGLLLVTLVSLWLDCYTVQGKCVGKWAIHACTGGNGKRSESTGYGSNLESNIASLPGIAELLRTRVGDDVDRGSAYLPGSDMAPPERQSDRIEAGLADPDTVLAERPSALDEEYRNTLRELWLKLLFTMRTKHSSSRR